MEESENLREVAYKTAVQAMIAVMMALRDTEAEPQLSIVVSDRELQWQRQSGTNTCRTGI